MKENKNKKAFKFIIILIFFSVLILLFFNKTTFKIFYRCLKYFELKSEAKILNMENQKHKNTLYLLENNPKHIKKIIKADFNWIEEGEVIYIFDNEEVKDEN